MRIAVDAMGGDQAPRNIIDGALIAARHLDVGIILVGPAELLESEIRRHPERRGVDVQVVDASEVVGMGELAAQALRRKPNASITVATELVARGEAVAVFSAGNTGAAVMAAHRALGLLARVDRPALATTIPTRAGTAILLDSGATVGCRPQHLVQFAALGAAYAQCRFDVVRPRIGLLSIGEEESKGTEVTREAHQRLKATPLAFVGNVEARDIFKGDADVIVCDGFTGNVVLKVGEGVVEMVEVLLKQQLSGTLRSRLAYLLAMRVYRRILRRMDYSEYGGAPLLGVGGLCVVGHGRSSPKAVRHGIGLASRLATGRLVTRIEQQLAAVFAELEPAR